MECSKQALVILFLGSFVVCNTIQAMEQSSGLYDEKSEMSFLMQAIEQKESGILKAIIIEEKIAVVAINRYVCSRKNCKYSTTHQIRINKHKQMHNLENEFLSAKIYRCETCDYLTDALKNLNEHKNSHSNIRPYPCSICDAKFKDIRSRNRHENTSHEKQISKKQALVRPLLVSNNR